MSKLYILILYIIVCAGTLFAQSEILTNKSVLDMIELGFSEDVILTKIKTTQTDFDTSIDALKLLKEKSVSDNIIVAMMNGNQMNTSGNTDVEVAEEENTIDRIGIYINQNGELLKIYPSVFSGTKTNTLGAAFSYGLANSTIKATLNNSYSNNLITSSRPEFIFFFPKYSDEAANTRANWWFFSASSPNEFVLAKLDVKGSKRELRTGTVNLYSGTNIGVDEDYVLAFDVYNIDEYTFKVIPSEPLPEGEYCFFYQGIIPNGGSNQSVFDFSISQSDSKKKAMKKSKKIRYQDDVYK